MDDKETTALTFESAERFVEVGEMDIEVITQIAIAIGIVLVFRILSSAASSIIIKILTYKKGGKKSVKKNTFYLPLKTIFTFIGIYIGLYMIKDVIALS